MHREYWWVLMTELRLKAVSALGNVLGAASRSVLTTVEKNHVGNTVRIQAVFHIFKFWKYIYLKSQILVWPFPLQFLDVETKKKLEKHRYLHASVHTHLTLVTARYTVFPWGKWKFLSSRHFCLIWFWFLKIVQKMLFQIRREDEEVLWVNTLLWPNFPHCVAEKSHLLVVLTHRDYCYLLV